MSPKYQQNKNIITSNIDNEVIMMSEDMSKYFGMNPVASEIWSILVNPKSIADIIENLTSQYDVTEDKCKDEVSHFLKELVDKKVVNVIY